MTKEKMPDEIPVAKVDATYDSTAVLTDYSFPYLGITVKASSLEEAMKIINQSTVKKEK